MEDLAEANAIWKKCNIEFVEVEKKAISPKETKAVTVTFGDSPIRFLDFPLDEDYPFNPMSDFQKLLANNGDEVGSPYIYAYYAEGLVVKDRGAKAVDSFFQAGYTPKNPGNWVTVATDKFLEHDHYPETLAHEIGHALGLKHVPGEGRLMHLDGDTGRAGTKLTDDECKTARNNAP